MHSIVETEYLLFSDFMYAKYDSYPFYWNYVVDALDAPHELYRIQYVSFK